MKNAVLSVCLWLLAGSAWLVGCSDSGGTACSATRCDHSNSSGGSSALGGSGGASEGVTKGGPDYPGWQVDSSQGAQDNVCAYTDTTKISVLLPEEGEPSGESLSYELCFNGTCSTLPKSPELGIIDLSMLPNGVKISFALQVEPCVTSCPRERYFGVIGARIRPNSNLMEGDVWQLTIRNADGSVYLQKSIAAGYSTIKVQGQGDDSGLLASCKALTVPAELPSE